MPRYQYACPDCGNQFEAQQKFTDKPLKKCPTCGKRSIHRVVGLVAVAFKGTGFYINDSKGGSTGKTAVKAEGEETKVETATDADAAAKPEAATDANAKPDAKGENGTEPAAKPAEKGSAEAPAKTKTDSAPSKTEAKPADKKAKRKA